MSETRDFQYDIELLGFEFSSGIRFEVDSDFVIQAAGGGDIFALFRAESDSEENYRKFSHRLEKFADCLVYLTGMPVRVGSGYGLSELTKGAPLELRHYGKMKAVPLIKPEKAEKELKDTADLSRAQIPKYLENAMMFFRKSILADTDEEALIYLIISLEAIFSRNQQELRYRLSLRAAYFLSGTDNESRKNRFQLVYEMYKLRNDIVHGRPLEKAQLKRLKSVSELRILVKESISRLIALATRLPDQKALVRLIDSSITDWNNVAAIGPDQSIAGKAVQ